MKKNLSIFLAAATMIMAVACDRNPGSESTVSVTIEIAAEDGAEIPEGTVFDVTVTNYDTRSEQTLQIGDERTAALEGLVIGRYTISVTANVSIDGVAYLYTGTVANANILNDGEKITVTVSVTESKQLLIKEMYYVFSPTESGGRYIHDQFIEIYNNSETTAYIDGLCIGNFMPELATGKATYDWGMSTTDYGFFAHILKVPGNSGETNYPVEPGESVLLCKWAKNHQAADANPKSPVDLSGGEFEYYYAGGTAQQDENAINLELLYFNTHSNYTQWTTSFNGWAYAIFFSEPNDFMTQDVTVTDPDTGEETTSTITTYNTENEVLDALAGKVNSYPIHVSRILDAVECVKNETEVVNKRVPVSLDAGAIWVTDDEGEAAQANGRSVVRKVASTLEDGRVILQDTNNSSNDFECLPAVARRYNTGIPAWNTWAVRK